MASRRAWRNLAPPGVQSISSGSTNHRAADYDFQVLFSLGAVVNGEAELEPEAVGDGMIAHLGFVKILEGNDALGDPDAQLWSDSQGLGAVAIAHAHAVDGVSSLTCFSR